MARPTLHKGYLGAQSTFQDYGIATVSHNSPEITTNTSPVAIKLKAPKPMKVTATLIPCSTGEEIKDLIFTQTENEGKLATILVNLSSEGFFKLQIFAMPSADDLTSLPNVYNYLIHSTAAPSSPVFPFPKQFAQWKDGCYLDKPYHLMDADNSLFEVTVPKAQAVAVTMDKEWFHFKLSDGKWKGEVKGLSRHRGKGAKAVLNASYVADSNKYTSLLEYTL